jgi:predicted CxxxxCH...CXXCH cytochrome family protein
MPQITKTGIIAVLISGALLALVGCSSTNSTNNQTGFNTETGKHVDNWYVDHRTSFLKNASSCAECHGTDLKGGISNVSCYSASYSGMTCHANGPSIHATGWENPDAHGASAKGAPSNTSGFSLCQICHGNDFVGGLVQNSCLNTAGCHGANVSAPHSPKPWRSGIRTHTNTDPNNAPVCAQCHTNGANSSVQPSPPAPTGTTPGCFNNTLCHASVGHPEGWENPDSHGATAKAAPSSTAGFSLCQSCHGSNFTGGAALQTCLNTAGCHGTSVNAPHSPKPWRSGIRTHTTTDPNNASVCAQCHTNGANSSVQPSPFASGTTPGCFNNTLCHASVGHPAGWANPDSHGATAKAAPSTTAGFNLCKSCHGSNFTGGAALQTCLNTAGCHGASVSAPHSPKPWRGGTRTHTNTDPNNATVCAACHIYGANSSVQPSPPAPIGTAAGCFNNTLCHATIGHPAGWALPSSHGTTAKAAPAATSGFSLCQSCHGNNFTGGTALQTCLSTAGCHGATVNAPHAFPWLPGSTYDHSTTDQGNAPACALCHLNHRTPPSYAAVPAGTTPGCFNNTLCHATTAHPAGWALPAGHGATAKAAPNATSGFSLCQSCHGINFTGGTALRTCLSTAGCHGATVNAPHAFPWMPGNTHVHTTTDPGNAPVCALCHLNNRTPPSYAAVPPGTTPGCFNNTLCHATPVHSAGWALPAAHGTTAKAAPGATSGFSLCQSCHGNNFTGGTALQTCLNTSGCHGAGVNAPHAASWLPGNTYTHTTTNQGNAPVCGLCHLNNRTPPSYAAVPAGTTPNCFDNTLCHAQVAAPHVVPYTSPALHGPAAKANLTYCETCHATPSNGTAGSNPRFNVARGNLAAGCEGASCHATNTAHPVPWKWANATSHQTAGNMANACVLCHGAALGGGTGPACSTCHTAGSPLTMANCTSCHGKPPTGAVYPNIAGTHTKHNALAGVTNTCNSCHNNAGTSTANHGYGGIVNVAFLAAYNAKSGTATFNAGGNTCSNVSCHGGQTTPNWLTGTINVNTQCTSCHAPGTSQYNSQNSGRHSTHASQGVACNTCHNTTLLAVNHFTHLNTTVMEGPASATLNSQLQYNGTSCNPSAGGLSGCHNSKSW